MEEEQVFYDGAPTEAAIEAATESALNEPSAIRDALTAGSADHAVATPTEGAVPAPVEGLSPINPARTAADMTVSRFSSAVWYDKVREKDIILAGCGGIGSYVGFLLGRMKPHLLILYDNDSVDETNLSGQLFRRDDVGAPKTTALCRVIASYTSFTHLYSIPRKYNSLDGTKPIMICGFDNMAARRIFYENWKTNLADMDSERRKMALFIDGRLAAEEFQVFAITGDNWTAMERYEKEFLFSDEEAEETLCSYKQTSYMANMIGSVMVNIFTNFCANECDLVLPREVPFLTTYRADYMDFKVER